MSASFNNQKLRLPYASMSAPSKQDNTIYFSTLTSHSSWEVIWKNAKRPCDSDMMDPFQIQDHHHKHVSFPLAQGNYSTLKLWEIVRMAAKHFSFKIPRYSAAKHGRQTIYQPPLDNRIVESAGIRQTWSLTLPQSLCSWWLWQNYATPPGLSFLICKRTPDTWPTDKLKTCETTSRVFVHLINASSWHCD